jgi:metal-responsive CopG/Arc/MetJ family transcriptional regulator
MSTQGDGDSVVAARISYSLRDSIDEAAASVGTTRSEYIRNALRLIISAERACQPERAA